MVNFQNNNTILTYKIGPVYCCSPCSTILSITQPTALTHLPGQNSKHSGIFKFNNKLVTVCELRQIFGVDHQYWKQPGRIIITELNNCKIGFWVDTIIDVMESPQSGWDKPSSLIPKKIFNKILIYNNNIHLFAEFEKLIAINQTGLLQQYIKQLNETNDNIIISRSNEKTIEIEAKATNVTLSNQKIEPLSKTNAVLNNNNTTISRSINYKTTVKSTNIEPPSTSRNLATQSYTLNKTQHTPKRVELPNQLTIRDTSKAPKPALVNFAHNSTNLTNLAKTSSVSNSASKSKAVDILVISLILISFLFAGFIGFTLDPSEHASSDISNNITTTIKSTAKIKIIASLSEPLATHDPSANQSATITKNNRNVIITINSSISPQAFEILEKEKELLNNRNRNYLNELENHKIHKNNKVSSDNVDNNSILTKKIIHIVVKGDTLWDIAKYYVNNPYQYSELARLSQIKNPDRIYPGNQVHILQIYTKTDE